MTMKHNMIPASAPTSPAITRSKTDRLPPVTPQRVSQSVRLPSSSSPFSPGTASSTPYTPFSLRSLSSSSNGSNLATPASAIYRRRLSLSLSPEVNPNSKSLADIAENWRTRAHENGIKVSSSDEPRYEVDESSLDISVPVIDKALLPAPFLSTQRRPRAFTHVQVPLSQIPDPTQLCTPNRSSRLQIALNTPPPQPAFRLRGSVTDPAQLRRRPPFGQTTDLFDIDENEYAPYPPAFAVPLPSQSLPLTLNDSFNMSANLSAISEPIQFYETPIFEVKPERKENINIACSVCGVAGGSLAILDPCSHPLCSACLTSALNIVGEKDMECAVCKAKVEDFNLHKTSPGDIVSNNKGHPSSHDDALFSNEFAGTGTIGFTIPEDYSDFMDRAQGASTPVVETHSAYHPPVIFDEYPVLRIDNVPWDITPPAIATWLKHPVKRVHVLLDRKGKTLSHAFVEMANPEAAKAALRTSQNSVLGRGKRARGVTVTKSSQEELMKALFPSWQGLFERSHPSLSGLSNERVVSTLQRGFLSEAELNSLLHLICSPDSHFLKVPSLPFHSLVSILSKFPADDDSRVFWSGNIRDLLYDVTFAAVQVLLARNEENPLADWAALITDVVRAAMDCQAFTSQQMSKLSDILEAALPKSISSPARSRTASQSPASSHSRIQEPSKSHGKRNPEPEYGTFGDLAHEFGVEPHLIEALARRLSGLREVGRNDDDFDV